jgi:nitrite reductase (NO-forming)
MLRTNLTLTVAIVAVAALFAIAVGVGANLAGDAGPAQVEALAPAEQAASERVAPQAHDVSVPELQRIAGLTPADLTPVSELPVVRGEVSYAPYAAAPVDRDYRAHVHVDLEVTEETMEIADGVTYDFWTFGGSVPGPMIRVREGDYVTVNLQNHPDSRFPHNIDLHSVTGQGGGAEATLIMPGQQAGFGFAALRPGVYIYHCATAPVGMHVANGMYGLIVVDPEDGWDPVDREYYVVQGDFYTPGEFGEQGHQPFDMQRAVREDASYVVFNGRVGSMTGDNAPVANVGDRVRIFFGNGGPNLISSFHVIGEIFETVYHEGGATRNHNVQTTLVPAGGATAVEMTFDVPSTYILVDHSIFRAFNKGALGMIEVVGEENHDVFHPYHDVRDYDPEAASGHGEANR